MKRTSYVRGFLRPAIFSACALAAFASSIPSSTQIAQEDWLTREEFRARDGSLLRLYEDHYSDVSPLVERKRAAPESDLAQSDYLDLGAAEEVRHSGE